MCGIAGIFDPKRKYSREAHRSLAAGMARTLRNRGPDDEGVWTEATGSVALGFRRLSIIDLSAAGKQPMTSQSGRYTLVFNGEIYNADELRKEIHSLHPESRFRGHSDTETMLAAFEAWEVEGALQKFNGMFAFALWDGQTRILRLARDRMGEKPLYYGWFGDSLLFASELKALRVHPEFDDEIDRGALTLLLRYNCIPAPYTIYVHARKLPPATMLSIEENFAVTETQFWSLREAMEQGQRNPFVGSEQEATEALEAELHDAIKMRMVADVPLGAFLSGGIDSSTVVALMQSTSSRPVNTFTIGVADSLYDEAANARDVALHLGTNHTELYLTPAEIRAVVPKLPEIYDEPFADSSQLPTYLLAAMARKHVTVALSGDGGDEFFGGYNRYLWLDQVCKASSWMPRALRRALAGAIKSVPVSALDGFYKLASPVFPRSLKVRLPGDKLHKIARFLDTPDRRAMYLASTSQWQQPSLVVIGACEPHSLARNGTEPNSTSSFVEKMMYFDSMFYLPDDILVKVDRATMATSLEARVPFLDHHLIEFSWRLPLSLKIRGKSGKWILRQILHKHVPASIVDRPKMGFGIPLHSWLRGPLRPWADELLNSDRLRCEGFLHSESIRQTWTEHLSGRHDWGHHLWGVLMFQAWLEKTRAPLLSAAEA